MPRYVTLVNWTPEGISDFKETVDRHEANEQRIAEVGARFVDAYWTLGDHDLVIVIEAPDDESATAALLMVGSAGKIRTKTMRAFTRDEMRAVIDKAA